MNPLPAWSVWALLSAVFAALTAVLAASALLAAVALLRRTALARTGAGS